MLQMLELSKGNNPVCIDDDLGTNLQSCFPKIINNYKTSFNSLMKGGNVLVSSVTAPQKALAYENASSKRLIPAVEQARKDNDAKRIKTFAISIPEVMPKKLKQVTCSFCKGPNHKISNCPLKDSFGEKQDGHTLVKYIHLSAPFSKLNVKDVNRIINTDVSGRRGFKHVLVHTIHVKYCVTNYQIRPQENDMVATVTFLDGYGKPTPGYNRCLLSLPRLIEYIYKHNLRSGRFIFSTIVKESVGRHFINIQDTQTNSLKRQHSVVQGTQFNYTQSYTITSQPPMSSQPLMIYQSPNFMAPYPRPYFPSQTHTSNEGN